MIRRIMALFALLPLAFHFFSYALADEIRWFYPDWRPAFLRHNLDPKQTGFGDMILDLIQQNLPGHDHRLAQINWARWERMVETGQDICFSSGFYRWPDNEGKPRKDLIWTGPYLAFSFHGLVIHRDQAERYLPGPVSLERLMADTSLTMLLEQGRTYSKPVQDLLDHYGGDANLDLRPAGAETTLRMMRMLALKRADYSLEYPLAFDYNASLAGVRDELMILPVQEHEGLFGYVSTACTNTDLGRTIIMALNARLDQIRQSPEMQDIARNCCILPGREEAYWQEWEKMRTLYQ